MEELHFPGFSLFYVVLVYHGPPRTFLHGIEKLRVWQQPWSFLCSESRWGAAGHGHSMHRWCCADGWLGLQDSRACSSWTSPWSLLHFLAHLSQVHVELCDEFTTFSCMPPGSSKLEEWEANAGSSSSIGVPFCPHSLSQFTPILPPKQPPPDFRPRTRYKHNTLALKT